MYVIRQLDLAARHIVLDMALPEGLSVAERMKPTAGLRDRREVVWREEGKDLVNNLGRQV
jgi:hypothetical protein